MLKREAVKVAFDPTSDSVNGVVTGDSVLLLENAVLGTEEGLVHFWCIDKIACSTAHVRPIFADTSGSYLRSARRMSSKLAVFVGAGRVYSAV